MKIVSHFVQIGNEYYPILFPFPTNFTAYVLPYVHFFL